MEKYKTIDDLLSVQCLEIREDEDVYIFKPPLINPFDMSAYVVKKDTEQIAYTLWFSSLAEHPNSTIVTKEEIIKRRAK